MHLFEIAPYVMMIMAAEFIIDWMKHAFIIKFNNLTVDIYPEYRAILAQDFITAKDPTKAIEYADQIRCERRKGTNCFIGEFLFRKKLEVFFKFFAENWVGNFI